jgi:chromosome segregation ATPase
MRIHAVAVPVSIFGASEAATPGATDRIGEVGSEESDLLAMLEAGAERERRARDRLIEARDELNDRDDAFATLEAEMWARVEQRERGVQTELASLRDENAALRLVQTELASLRDENAALRLHLEWILASPPELLLHKAKAAAVAPCHCGMAWPEVRGRAE